MNRLEMKEYIAEQLPDLIFRYKDELKGAEKLRREFVRDYPLSKIRAMKLDEYVIGKGSSNRSFCYRLEREMDSLGRILGATAFKFGVYFGKIRNDPREKYRFSHIWGNNVENAFASVKDALVALYQAGYEGDTTAIVKNRLSPLFKGKILYVYFPNKFIPIYSERHLEYFLARLNISGKFKNGIEMQDALMKYRRDWPELSSQPILLYMRLLYEKFSSPENPRAQKAEDATLPLLDFAVSGAEFIAQIPVSTKSVSSAVRKAAKVDYERKQKQQKRIGDRGEYVVVELEKRRLIQAGKPELAKNIKHISQETDSAGYDILSFDDDGTARHIEVKATSANNLDKGFYLSDNEVECAKTLPNYYIYFVFSALTTAPRVFPMKHPRLDNGDFHLQPITYHATMMNYD